MGSPYREAALIPEADRADAAPTPLARFDVSGGAGADGMHGRSGTGYGEDGHDAGPASPGQPAGMIRLELLAERDDAVVRIRGETVAASGSRKAIDTTAIIGDAGAIALRAVGGAGGAGGNGGTGADGARGSDGSDASRYFSGSNGGDGGPGGDGGDATSGAAGGAGGDVVIRVADADTPLLMLIEVDQRGGGGGAPGANGRGGDGGAGGRGGSSYSWSEDESYTDSAGQHQTRTHHHSNAGGRDGSSGPDGSPGNARVRRGGDGAAGRFAIEVVAADGVHAYPSRYDLRLVGFAHDSLNEDCVYEPGEQVRVFGLEVENVGGMPTPAKDALELGLVAGGWVEPERGALTCAPGLAAGARHTVAGELRFRIADHTPSGPGEPLEVEESIVHRAMLPSVHRELTAYQTDAAIEAGKFVIRFPARASATTSLRSLVPGEATRVRFSIRNASRIALGAASACKRVLRVRVATAADSELGDDHVAFTADGAQVAPSAGWVHDLASLAGGDTVELELTLTVKPGAPDYRRFAAEVTLELGALDAPARVVPIQIRAFDVRVARPFQVSDADLLLVVNHRTTREEIEAWEGLATRLAFKLAVWDLTRERHLDLEAALGDGVSLATWFGGKAIVILDNEIDGPDGPIHPHVFLAPDQAVRAAAAGIDIAFVGQGPALRQLLIPPLPGTAVTPMYRRYWLRWWAEPAARWLARQARAVGDQLRAKHPDQRHVVVHRFAPKVASRFLWIKKWQVGTIETERTLDTAAGAIVHAAASDAGLHAPAYAASALATTAVLVMFGFDENLERMRRALAEVELDPAKLAAIADALVLDVANELAAAIAPGGDAPRELDALLPRIAALGSAKLTAPYDTIGGNALIQLAGRIRFVADSCVPWWQKPPPLRWTARAARVRARVNTAVDRLLAGAFGDHNLDQTRADAIVVEAELDARHRRDRKMLAAGPRRQWALDQARLPLAVVGITSDTEVLDTAEQLVLDGGEYDAIAAGRTRDAVLRARLVADAATQHAQLAVK